MEGYYAQNSFLKQTLTDEEQNKYLELATQGDTTAQQILFEHNLRLVKNIINTHFSYLTNEEKEDAFQVGSIGLWKAITNYTPEFNAKLSTYAFMSIYGEIKNSYRYNNLLLVPMPLQKLYKKICALKTDYEQKGKQINEQQIAEILNVSEAEVLLAIQSSQNLSSLSQTIKSDNDNKVLEDIIADESELIEDKIEKKIFIEEIHKCLNGLDKKEQEIIKLLFGFGCEKKSQKEIENLLNLSKYQANELKKKTLIKLKKIMIKKELIVDEADIRRRNSNSNICTRPIQELYNTFPEYSEEQILEAIKNLSSENKTIVEIVYGLNEEQNTSIEDKNQRLNVLTKNYQKRLYYIKIYLKDFLKNGSIKTSNFFNFFEGHSEQEILSCLEQLSEEQQELIELKFGLNGKNTLCNKEIGYKYNLSGQEINKRIQRAKAKIKRLLDKPKITINQEDIKNANDLFSLYPEYSEEQILGSITTISNDNRQIIELRYGLNGKEPTSITKIAEKIEMPLSYTRNKIRSIKKQISSRLTKGIFKRDIIFDLYPEYTEEQILGAISTLTEENKAIIEKRYGLNGEQYTDLVDIAESVNTTIKKINSRIGAIRKQIQTRLEKGIYKRETIFDLYPEYSAEQILGAMTNLPDESQKILELRYGLNGEEPTSIKKIAEILNINYHKIKLNKIEEKLLKILKKGIYKKETIFDLYPEYSEEQILGAIKDLKEENQQIIELKYGLNGKEKKEAKEISEILNTSSKNILSRIIRIKQQILKNLEKGKCKRKTIFDLYPEYTEKQILGAITTLSLKKQKIIELKYGLNGNAEHENEEISKTLDLPLEKIVIEIRNIKNQISNRLEQGKFKRKTIFDLYPEYSEEQILGAIKDLNKENQQIIELKYGLNGKECTELKEMSEILNLSTKKINSRFSAIENQIKRRLDQGIYRRETIFDLYPEYSEEQILGAITTLNKENRKIIELKYGLNGEKIADNDDIAQMSDISTEKISRRINTIKQQIFNRLEQGRFKRKTIFDLYPEYSEEQILGAIKDLTKENQQIIELKYGLNGKEYTELKEMSKILNLSTKKINSRLLAIEKQIKRRLEQGIYKRETIFDIYPDYSEEQVLGAITTLSLKKQKIIELKCGLNGNTEHKNEEIANILNLPLEKIYNEIRSIKKQILYRLEKGKYKTETIFDLYPDYSEKEILEAIRTLKEENIKIIIMRYGLCGFTALSCSEIETQYNMSNIHSRVYRIKHQIENRLIKNRTKITSEDIKQTTQEKSLKKIL